MLANDILPELLSTVQPSLLPCGLVHAQQGIPVPRNTVAKAYTKYTIPHPPSPRFSVSSWSSHGGGLYHGLRRTKVGARMPRTVGVVLAH